MKTTVCLVLCLMALAGCDKPQPPAPPASTPPPAAAEAPAVRMPGEFETQAALLLGTAQMVQFHPQTIVDVVAAVHERVRVVALVSFKKERDDVARLLLDARLPAGCVTFFYLPVTSMWTRDYAPLSVVDAAGKATFLDAAYRGEGAAQDDGVPVRLGADFGVPVVELPLTMEGGDLLSDGQGLCLSTRRLITRNQEERGDTPEQVWALLQKHCGFTDWFPLPSLSGEPTGHLDMFATIVAPLTVVIGQYDPAVDADNAKWLDWCAHQLASRPTSRGPVTVARIPMPPHDDGVWRTYTNVVFANGVLLVPAYPDVCPDLDAKAREVFARLLPDWRVVSIDCEGLVPRNGALHCVTMGLPSLPGSRD
jgi:agmatine/peptidylarginine deiminase